MIVPDNKALKLLFRYNKIVIDLIQESTVEAPMSEKENQNCTYNKKYTIDISKWSSEYLDLTSQVESIKALYPAFFVENNDSVMNLDLLQEQNVFHVLLYSAVMLQWYSLDPKILFSADNFARGYAFNKSSIKRMKSNLRILSNPKCIKFLTDQNLNNEIKALVRTLALYFYIRAHGGSITLNLFLFIDKKYKWKLCKIIQNNRKLEDFLRNLYHTSVCKEVYKRIIPAENESVYGYKLAELFDYVIENSYYAHLPRGLYGLIAIDHKIFISSEYMEEKEEDKEDEEDEEEKEEKEDEFEFGPTLIILLHEIANLSSRFWELQNSYFRITPREYKNPSDPGRSYIEIGDYLESLLFGDKLQGLYSGGVEVLLNIDNWNLPIDEFRSYFHIMQEDCRANRNPVCTLTRGNGIANCVKFGRCGMSYWTSRS
ncbi:unnamed protein product [Blepharisma stoltei]|uniref:Uncharacterized protein n=1 Tax=Blepharisma stoltei TaxID=1481888 RepID=A0AAU9IEM3_9CILI|nr:unnamed protein product [Blepharisma stoltei]